MFSFVGKTLGGVIGGTAESFSVRDFEGRQAIELMIPNASLGGSMSNLYLTGQWTVWTYGAVALEIDLDATNESR